MNEELQKLLEHIRGFGLELHGLHITNQLLAARYARDRLIEELAKLNKVLAIAEAEARKKVVL